jgi:hypothetical protein
MARRKRILPYRAEANWDIGWLHCMLLKRSFAPNRAGGASPEEERTYSHLVTGGDQVIF